MLSHAGGMLETGYLRCGQGRYPLCIETEESCPYPATPESDLLPVLALEEQQVLRGSLWWLKH